jgi:predicted amidohydrolase
MKPNQTKQSRTSMLDVRRWMFNVLLTLSLLLPTVLMRNAASAAELQAVLDSGCLNLSWEMLDSKLQEAAMPEGPWQTVTMAVNPYRASAAYAQRFYRLIAPAPGQQWLTVAAVTMTSQTNTATNLEILFSYMAQAASNGVHLVVFPEMALQGCAAWWDQRIAPLPEELACVQQTAETIPGASTSNIVAKAKELNLFVVFGMTEKDETGLLYNANVFLGPEGVIGKHRKSHFVGNDSQIWSRGSGYEALDSPLGKIGLIICAEMWSGGDYPGPILAGQGADLLATSSAWWIRVADSFEAVTVSNAVLYICA